MQERLKKRMKNTDILKIGIAQMTSIDDVETNLLRITHLALEAKKQNAEIIFYPENCLYMRMVEGEKIQGLGLGSEPLQRLSDFAKKENLFLHLGSIPLLEEGGLTNATVLIDSQGEVDVVYRKIHLFDIQLENQKPHRESDVFRRGNDPTIIDINGFRIGQSICYDIRFSELYQFYAAHEVDAMTIPAAFLKTTGEAHWDILLRARAIESQCYVIASAQAGPHHGKKGGVRETFGHSQLVDPWGRVDAVLPQAEGLLVTDLNKQRIQQVRRQIPMKQHRRL